MKVCTINLKAPRKENSLEEKDYEVEAIPFGISAIGYILLVKN